MYLNAQRWGSALPAARHEPSDAVKTLSGVVYEPQRSRLAPTRKETLDQESFVSDDQLMLFQAGDMVSSYTPGFESAVLSAIELVQHLEALLGLEENDNSTEVAKK